MKRSDTNRPPTRFVATSTYWGNTRPSSSFPERCRAVSGIRQNAIQRRDAYAASTTKMTPQPSDSTTTYDAYQELRTLTERFAEQVDHSVLSDHVVDMGTSGDDTSTLLDERHYARLATRCSARQCNDGNALNTCTLV